MSAVHRTAFPSPVWLEHKQESSLLTADMETAKKTAKKKK
jgi:hypothetical protein